MVGNMLEVADDDSERGGDAANDGGGIWARGVYSIAARSSGWAFPFCCRLVLVRVNALFTAEIAGVLDVTRSLPCYYPSKRSLCESSTAGRTLSAQEVSGGATTGNQLRRVHTRPGYSLWIVVGLRHTSSVYQNFVSECRTSIAPRSPSLAHCRHHCHTRRMTYTQTRNHVVYAISRAGQYRRGETLPSPLSTTTATTIGQGKTCGQAEGDCVGEVIDTLNFHAHFCHQLYQTQPPKQSGSSDNRLDYRPLEGFVLGVSPFNFTALGAHIALTPALVGNVVLWKPSLMAVLSNYLLYQIMEEAGLPACVVQFLPVADPPVVISPTLATFRNCTILAPQPCCATSAPR